LPVIKKRGSKFRYCLEFSLITLMGLWWITALHLRKRFDVVHVHNMPDVLVFFGLLAKWTGARLLLDVHDPMPELYAENYNLSADSKMARALEFQEQISFRRVDHLVTVSSTMAENVARKAGVPEDSVLVVHNFPDLNLFPILAENNGWPHNKDRFVFLYAGTVTEHYRLDVAVRAFAKASEVVPQVRFRILGDGPKLLDVLALAESLGVRHIVEVVPPVPNHEVKDQMAAADAGISTHQAGVFGDLYFSTKIVEYMTQGLPVLSTRTHTISKYIPENAIFFFESDNVDDLAEKIVRICENPDVVAERVRNSRALLSKYVWQAEEEKFLSFYENVVAKNRG
jgi:glycosyltransferase involved in cell wall biosynthesis